MKKIFISVLLIFCVTCISAQNPQLPPGTKPGQLPVPELRPLTPPDLRVEELSLVSVIRDGNVKKINIQVLIRIKNYGTLHSGASTALAYIKSPAGTGTQRTLTTTFPTPAINPGASFVKVFTFREGETVFRPGSFDFWIKADARNAVTESNETNNTSTVINIAVPAR
jgi:subtilase family serine protease